MGGMPSSQPGESSMMHFVLLACATLAFAACTSPPTAESNTPAVAINLGETAATDRAWAALANNTSSQDRANWEVVEARVVQGAEIAELFEGDARLGCWFGPEPPANRVVEPAGSYWYVQMRPAPATPLPPWGTTSPTAPPRVPEPFLKDAQFLIDPAGGMIVARRLVCVVY